MHDFINGKAELGGCIAVGIAIHHDGLGVLF